MAAFSWRHGAGRDAGAGRVRGGGGGGGSAGGVPPPVADAPVRVTGTTPFAPGCDGGAGFGTPYASAEVEPMIAVNPRDANNLVGVWQQDRWPSAPRRG